MACIFNPYTKNFFTTGYYDNGVVYVGGDDNSGDHCTGDVGCAYAAAL